MSLQELRVSDISMIADAARRIHQCRSYSELEQATHAVMHEVVDVDVSIWNNVTMDMEINAGSSWPLFGEKFLGEILPPIEEHLAIHPFCDFLIKNRPKMVAMQLTDRQSVREFKKHPIYVDAYNKWSCLHQCSVAVDTGFGDYLLISVNRSSGGFATREVEMLGALAPHLLRSFNAVREIDDLERSIASLRKGHNAESSFWLVLGPTFYIVNGSVNAQACLTRSFRNHVLGLHPPVALIDRLKRISDDWALGQLSLDQRVGRFEISDAEVPLQCVYRQIDLQHYRFEASEVLAPAVEPMVDSLLEESIAVLTPREREVLVWLSRGKMNPEIGIILGVSTRTVEKHLQSAYAKLGLHSRASLIHQSGNRAS